MHGEAGPSELAAPAYSWRSASFAAATYTLAIHYYGFFTPQEGLAILTFFFVGHTILGEMLKRPLDFTRPLSKVLYGMTNIPDPADNTRDTASKVQKVD